MNVDFNFPNNKGSIYAEELDWSVAAAEGLKKKLGGRSIDYIVCR
jgi:hypothetical protein